MSMPWVQRWEDAVSKGKFSGSKGDDRISGLNPVSRLYAADKIFSRDCTGLWPSSDLPEFVKEEDSLEELYCFFRYYIGILTWKPDPRRFKANPTPEHTQPKPFKPRPSRRPKHQNIRLSIFIHHPYIAVRHFLSYDFYDNGHIFKRHWCRDAAHLLWFYVDFLIRFDFWGAECVQELLATKKLLEVAKIELPRTMHIARALPWSCAFSAGCINLWPVPRRSPTPITPEVSTDKKQDISAVVDVISASDISAHRDDSPVYKVNLPTSLTVEDNTSVHDIDEDLDDFEKDHWTGHIDFDTDFKDRGYWSANPTTLMVLLGPTSLPLTHRVGLVETSTRRILRVISPRTRSPNVVRPVRPQDVTHDPARAVEQDLAERLARVVLEPWGPPSLYCRGPSDILDPSVISPDDNAPDFLYHDAEEDKIDLLMDPGVAECLRVGMGISGAFVQVVSMSEQDGEERARRAFWYVEHVASVLPSFYVDVPPAVSRPSRQ